ncbi:MAG: hypothetical protein NTY00_03030 [Deltaproteobacteria bacterium]|nr:hypothetical protein [Deltaproteobacteria bacterium]
MKRVLSTVAALGLVAGIATSASALELKVKGTYTVDGFYIDNGAGAASTNNNYPGGGHGLQLASNPGQETNSDAWLQHMFNIEAELVVNDKISMMSRVRLIGRGTVWGAQDDTDVDNGKNMSVERLWMMYKSPIGLWEIGRRSGGAFGLSFVDTDDKADRITWKSGNLFGDVFSLYAYFEKQLENEAYLGNTDNMDADYYDVEGTLKGNWGAVTLGYGLKQDNTKNSADLPASTTWSLNSTTGLIGSSVTPAFYGYETTTHRIRGVGQFKFGGNMGIDTEFDYKFGNKDFYSAAKQDQDISQLAFIIDLNATIADLTGHAMYFHTSGDDNPNDTDLKSYGSTGWDFEPLYIVTGIFGNILNNYQGPNTSVFGTAAQTAGVNAIVVSTDFSATQDLTLHAAIGYATADKEMAGWDNEYGFEYNAGVAYRLLDNLVYAVHLGYLDTGDFFKLGKTYRDTNSIFLASHHLTMSF